MTDPGRPPRDSGGRSGERGSVPRSILPGALAVHADASGEDGRVGGPVRRTARDWAVDALAFAWAVGIWAVLVSRLDTYDYLPDWLVALDAPLGAVACIALWWRRRFPLLLALIMVPVGALTNSGSGAGIVIILNLALRVPWQRSLPVLCAMIAAVAPYVLIYSVPYEGGWAAAVFVLAYFLVFFAWGSALRARRLLVLKLREDADRERTEHARRLAESRRAERTAIAREMHDVLAHRISLLSVHAGALAYRTRKSEAGSGAQLSGAEIAESAQVIRDNAHQALNELRDVLYVLRTDTDSGEPAPPQPDMADLLGLVDEARAAGQTVDYGAEVDSASEPPRPQLQRTAYRVVQEGLTNARKHAPGSPVKVRVYAGSPREEVTVEVSNPLPAGVAESEIPGAGAGLTGLHERVELDGGTLRHGSVDGTFTLSARLPWHSPPGR
ncbi:sensor histidine kinase [Streptomyces niveus]|uniref:histidine kinase n=1 Tax=Streptomyces niveus TaxID=193462 RepID=A0ABZ2A676_STRNV|nr:histidine kinase [Streptomyces niveus]